MITLINKVSLYNTFGVNDFCSIEEAINNMAPSMVEYYLSDLKNDNEDMYLNKKDIENTLYIGDYNLYIDYNDNIYLEFNNNSFSTSQSSSFW